MWHAKLHDWITQGVPCALATVVASEGAVPRKAGAKLVLTAQGSQEGSVGGGAIERQCIDIARSVLESGTPALLTFALDSDDWNVCETPGTGVPWVKVFIEPVMPASEIVVFGGGHVAQSLGRLASAAGLAFRLCDERPAFASRERFPNAQEIVCLPYADITSRMSLSSRSHCLVCTHAHSLDALVLEQLAKRADIPYIGLVGSTRKLQGIRTHLAERGVHLDGRVYCPAGLALGGGLPEEIALSVLAEIKLVMGHGQLRHLRELALPSGAGD